MPAKKPKQTSLKLKLLKCFLEYIPLPQLLTALQQIEREKAIVMDFEDFYVSVRCSDVSCLIDDEEEEDDDDDDDNLDNSSVTGTLMLCSIHTCTYVPVSHAYDVSI